MRRDRTGELVEDDGVPTVDDVPPARAERPSWRDGERGLVRAPSDFRRLVEWHRERARRERAGASS